MRRCGGEMRVSEVEFREENEWFFTCNCGDGGEWRGGIGRSFLTVPVDDAAAI